MPGPPQKGNLACALAFHSVNRTAAQFILRSRCAGLKGSGHRQVGVVDVAVALVFRRHPEPAQRVKDLSSLAARRDHEPK
jgi:hypothetical protein